MTYGGIQRYNICMPLGNQVNIRVDDSLLEKLKKLAKERYSTPSQVVREALALYLKRVSEEDSS